MIQIELSTPTAPVTMRSCSNCDRREWFVDSEPTDLEGALGQIATTGRR